MSYKSLSLPIVSLLFLMQGHAESELQAPCDKGNFAMPPSQLIGPLISFGQNIIGANQAQLFLLGQAAIGDNAHFISVVPSILYAPRDDFSIFFNVPIAAQYKQGEQHSSGLEDLFLQLEYAFYIKVENCVSQQATLVANASFPTGSAHKQPATGFGAMSYFVGATYNYTAEKWYTFTSYGAELPTAHHGKKSGNQYLYQWGMGRNFANPTGWILDWLVELDGTFFARNKIHGRKDPNSGGNVIYLTPSLWASSMRWILQAGVGYAIVQNLFGNQSKERLLIAIDVGYTF